MSTMLLDTLREHVGFKEPTAHVSPVTFDSKFEWALTAKFLLDAAADPLRKDLSGQNAIDMAAESRDYCAEPVLF